MKTIHSTSRLAAALIMAAGLVASNAWAAGAQQPAAHEHGSEHATQAKPLPAGKRWPTDAALRQGMTQIRTDVAAQLPAVHHDELTPQQYAALAQKTEIQVGQIVANCKLQPDADAALHGILAQIGEGTEAMAGKSKMAPREGVVKVVAAINEYGRTFDHPGWKKLH
jgi:hypothetical protein